MSMEFRTRVMPLPHIGLINHHREIVMIGSCFSDNIGSRLRQAGFDVNINPFGTLYNPASIANGIDDIITCRTFTHNDLIQVNGDNRWHSFSHHSSFSSIDADAMLENINRRLKDAHKVLSNASTLIVTFGTAWVYRHASTHKVVANCHKLPSSTFERRLMSIDEIVTLWQGVIMRLRQINPLITVIFTVSPIRHLRDGVHENQLSKSTLHLSISQLMQDDEKLIYFPAYEIMNDDLRDYRFYASDMTHPSEVAVDYIYDLFGKSFFDDTTAKVAIECCRLTRRLSHRPMSDDQKAVNRFVTSTQELKDRLLQRYPFLESAILKILTK